MSHGDIIFSTLYFLEWEANWFDQTVPFSSKVVLFEGISWQNYAQSALFKDFGCYPKILDYTLYPQYKNALPLLLKVRKIHKISGT